MKAEMIAVGTELLMGQIVNSNAQYIAKQLAANGIFVYYQTVVGDNPGRIAEAFRIAASRADVIICTGGLGPTQDDVTKDVLAETLGLKLVYHEPTVERMNQYYNTRGWTMVESNKRQAFIVEGHDWFPNDTGMALGVAITAKVEEMDKQFILLPGPPNEMTTMLDRYALPWLNARSTDQRRLYSKMLKFAGIGESNLEHMLLDLISTQTDVTIAPYAAIGEVAIRLTVYADHESQAEQRMKTTVDEISRRLSDHLYAMEDIPLEQAVVRLLSERQLKLAVAESCTGGLVGQMITAIPGSSAMFDGGVIVYSNESKHRWLGVPMELMEGEHAPGAVSEQTAQAMAESLLKQTGVDFAVAVTGVAGPTGSERKPVGVVYTAIAGNGKNTMIDHLQLTGDRATIRLRAAKHILFRLWKMAANV